MNLWKNWKEAVFDTFPELYHHSTWAEWEGKEPLSPPSCMELLKTSI